MQPAAAAPEAAAAAVAVAVAETIPVRAREWTAAHWASLMKAMRARAEEKNEITLFPLDAKMPGVDPSLLDQEEEEGKERRIRFESKSLPMDVAVNLDVARNVTLLPTATAAEAPFVIIPRPFGPGHFGFLTFPPDQTFQDDEEGWKSLASGIARTASQHATEKQKLLVAVQPVKLQAPRLPLGRNQFEAPAVYMSKGLFDTWTQRIRDAITKAAAAAEETKQPPQAGPRGPQPGVAVGGDLWGCVSGHGGFMSVFVQHISGLTPETGAGPGAGVWTTPEDHPVFYPDERLTTHVFENVLADWPQRPQFLGRWRYDAPHDRMLVDDRGYPVDPVDERGLVIPICCPHL